MTQTLRPKFKELETPPPDASREWFQKRGRKLERLINKLLHEEGLEPRTNYRPQGEEVDGSFLMNGRVFLLEAKWHKDKLPASSIYQFKGKIDGKLSGTLGVFISISGYSEDAVTALRFGKTLNVILFDGDDFGSSLVDNVGFKQVLGTKLRIASETGDVYFPYKHEEALTDPLSDILFVVEGALDELIIGAMVAKLMAARNLERRINFIPAMGKYAVANMAKNADLLRPADARLVLMIDSDGDKEYSRRLLASELAGLEHRADIIVVHPSIEAWLFPGTEDPAQRLLAFMKEENIRQKRRQSPGNCKT